VVVLQDISGQDHLFHASLSTTGSCAEATSLYGGTQDDENSREPRQQQDMTRVLLKPSESVFVHTRLRQGCVVPGFASAPDASSANSNNTNSRSSSRSSTSRTPSPANVTVDTVDTVAREQPTKDTLPASSSSSSASTSVNGSHLGDNRRSNDLIKIGSVSSTASSSSSSSSSNRSALVSSGKCESIWAVVAVKLNGTILRVLKISAPLSKHALSLGSDSVQIGKALWYVLMWSKSHFPFSTHVTVNSLYF